jgi:parallel beta-helix repeat protein
VIEGNTFTDTAPRHTRNPVTPIDLVGASFWRVSGNIITDFVRGFDGPTTYGAFFKGAGEGNIMQRNLVICELNLTQAQGQHVGLSLGGGGTDMAARREQGHTGFEQIGGVIRDNLIAFCSDDGIYLNRSARSVIDHNTLLDTAGIDVRFSESSGQVTGNLIDGMLRGRDGGSLRQADNARPFLLWLFAGVHPQRWLFRDPGRLDLRWRGKAAPLSDSEQRTDLCGRLRASRSPPGASEDFAACADPDR